MIKVRQKDINEARAYVIERISAEQSMLYNLESVMREAAERIVEICYEYNTRVAALEYTRLPRRARLRIDEVMQWVYETLEDYCVTLALYRNEDDDDLLAWFKRETYGKTFSARLRDYVEKYRTELLLLAGAGLAVGMGRAAIARSIGANLRQPWNNPDLPVKDVPSYGQGHTNSMYTAIGTLTRYSIADTWMHAKYQRDRDEGAHGWIVRRSSTYPCPLCDSMEGYHADDSELPPYHNSCVCVAIPVFL